MEFQIRLHPRVAWQIARWGLSDYLLVEVYLTLREVLGANPLEHLVRDDEGGGAFFSFLRVDPPSPLFRHIFHFRVYYNEDERHLNVVEASYFRIFVPQQ